MRPKQPNGSNHRSGCVLTGNSSVDGTLMALAQLLVDIAATSLASDTPANVPDASSACLSRDDASSSSGPQHYRRAE